MTSSSRGPSQKAIVIGKGGSRLREVGTNARRQIEALLGQAVFLDLHVKVAKDRQRDPKQLQRLGFCPRPRLRLRGRHGCGVEAATSRRRDSLPVRGGDVGGSWPA